MIYVVFFSNGGVPATGLSPAIGLYKKVSDGTDVTPEPTVSEVGGGFYKFTAFPAEALVVQVNGGAGLANGDRYKVMQITPHDADLDAQVSTRAPESGGNLAAIKAKTDNLPAAPAVEGNVQGHVADALAAYDPPTRDEAMADKSAILAAVAALNDLTVGEILSGDLSDNLSFPTNSLADLVRKLFWLLCNRLVIDAETGAFIAYRGDGATPGATGTFNGSGRSAPTWP